MTKNAHVKMPALCSNCIVGLIRLNAIGFLMMSFRTRLEPCSIARKMVSTPAFFISRGQFLIDVRQRHAIGHFDANI